MAAERTLGAGSQGRLSRQNRAAHQEFIDGARRLAALADGPDHQRLSATHIARGKHLVARRAVGLRVGLDVAAFVEFDAKLPLRSASLPTGSG